jgi:UDP-N-acetylglucosamine:LPS N-acetylglucosamine transferase
VRILLVGSSGGHLAQLLALRDWWEDHERHWVTFGTADAHEALADEAVTWGFHPTTRNVVNLVRNTRLARREIRRFKPDVVISTGAGIALPFFLFARVRRVVTVYLEVYDRIDSTTLTGRLCKPFTDLFLVQWEQQQQLYPGSVVVGTVW